MGLRRTIREFRNKKKYIEALKNSDNLIPKFKTNITTDLIHFPSFKSPRVSIIIPFYNQHIHTLNCLLSISQNLPNTSFEIIIIDDCSSENFDYTTIQNISVLKNKENLGFLRSVNEGIKKAQGDFIYLLNNDTIVTSGFLDQLLIVFETKKNVGAVGSMLLNPDGTLQEAGSFFIKNGAGQLDHTPTFFPQLNYIYKIDYGSGCSLLFKKFTDNHEINLFDEQFSPAYFEDSDLCFTFKYVQNKEVYFSPFSKIYHFHGVTYGNEQRKVTKSQPKEKLLDKNSNSFYQKWEYEIANISSHFIQQRILELYGNRSLVIFHDRVPEYDNNSGDLRLTEIIKSFLDLDYNITLVVPKNRIDNPYNHYFQKLGVCIFYEHKLLKEYNRFFRKLALEAPICWFSTGPTFKSFYKLAKSFWAKGKFIFDMVDIHHLRYLRALDHEPNNKHYRREYKKTLRAESFAAKYADIIIPISHQEANYMEDNFSPKKIAVISNVHYSKVSLKEVPSFEERQDILFIGSQHHPNIDAVRFLANEIMPIVWQKNPFIKLNVIGNLNTLVTDINHPNIKFHGYVPDITAYFYNNKLMVAPLRSGAGVKGKIGQAFEYFLPVITSKIGAEGMELIDNSNAILAESAEEFAASILSLYTDKSLWTHLQSNSEKSLEPFSKEKLRTTLVEIINAVH
ncbi:glycosyltransferase [Sphingobacterium siyangense]|uniref:glycosyltransferase n=1 Tax=Sphingobacterium siyangense TaxID=459529 RepID=UPI003DA535B2